MKLKANKATKTFFRRKSYCKLGERQKRRIRSARLLKSLNNLNNNETIIRHSSAHVMPKFNYIVEKNRHYNFGISSNNVLDNNVGRVTISRNINAVNIISTDIIQNTLTESVEEGNRLNSQFHLINSSFPHELENTFTNDANDEIEDESMTNNCQNKGDEQHLLQNSLAAAFVETNMNHVQINRTLKVLRQNKSLRFLPKTARKLLKTPRIAENIQSLTPGEYIHIGVENALTKLLNNCTNEIPCKIEVDLHSDGGTLNKKCSVWAILCRIFNINKSKVELIGLYRGTTKPASSEEFLFSLVEDAQKIKEKGVMYKGKKVAVKFRCLIADAPARAFLLGHRYHNAKTPCSKCHVKGFSHYTKNKRKLTRHTVFLGTTHMPRLTQEYHDRIDTFHHFPKPCSLDTIFSSLVHDVPFEYMHLVLLGVTRKLLSVPMLGNYNARALLHVHSRDIVNKRLSATSVYCPTEYARKVTDLSRLNNLKATEIRQILLVTGMIIFRGILPDYMYLNFLLLHAAIRCLCYYVDSEIHLRFSEMALKQFVKQAPNIYGKAFLSYNTHGLLHLVDDARRFGCLDDFSAFPFENVMGSFAKLVRKPTAPLKQIANRIAEKNFNFEDKNNVEESSEVQVSKEHFAEKYPSGYRQFQKVILKTMTVRTRVPDNAICMNSEIFVVKNIIQYRNSYYLKVNKFKKSEPFYDVGLPSTELGVFLLDELEETAEMIPLNSIQKKCFLIPLSIISDNDEYDSDISDEVLDVINVNKHVAICM